jgi:hypothetical protein
MNLLHFFLVVLISLFQSSVDLVSVAYAGNSQVTGSVEAEYSASIPAADIFAVAPLISESVDEEEEEDTDYSDYKAFFARKGFNMVSTSLLPYSACGTRTTFSPVTPLFLLFQVFRN